MPAIRPARPGRNCVEDGSKLVSARLADEAADTSPVNHAKPVSLFDDTSAETTLPQATIAPTLPSNSQSAGGVPKTLKLVNKPLNIDITLQNGDVIGRTQGRHAAIFSGFSQVSGGHAQFSFDGNNWQVKDLGSTNGTAISDAAHWDKTPKLPPHVATPLPKSTFILIANIEFRALITSAIQKQPANQHRAGTQRL